MKNICLVLVLIILFNFISASTDISSCQTLSSPNEIYVLTQNISSYETCFIIAAENITLDCQGYSINYSIGGENNQAGIYSSSNYSVVKNCSVIDGNSSSLSSDTHGILV